MSSYTVQNVSTSSESDSGPIQDDIDIDGDGSVQYGAQEVSNPDSTDSTSQVPETDSPVTMASRAYQLEMLDESLKQNIIVAMDTGSGKTQVAVLRILAELERSTKLIWFLAPTVVLVDQQLERIEEQIPFVVSKRLCGDDNVDTWSDQRIWDAFLENVRIVVSTPEVLLRALQHGFVSIRSLGLVIFDEAHNCKRNAPGARIMREFYWPAKQKDREAPHILGLTASPVISGSLKDLVALESTLDAICRAPTRHREELLSYVNVPEMSVISYGPPETADQSACTRSMLSLQNAFRSMDIMEDPTIIRLRGHQTERSRHEILMRIQKHDTPAQRKMRSFCHSSIEIMQQLGRWAADYYIHKVVSNFLSEHFKPDGTPVDDPLGAAETRYLGAIFRSMDAQPPASPPTDISAKMRKLLDTLESYEGDLRGIVFAKERTTVAVMAHLLSLHPEIHGRFKVASMVGTSHHHQKKRDFLQLGNGDIYQSLEDFRRGKVSILVATTVLEEGIDVPACNIVICFEKPETLKSFIQRRGRARMNTSKLILLLDDQSTGAAKEWRELELEMKKQYEDETRQLEVIREIEESEHPDYPPLEVEREDGHLARLTIDDAKAHLEHFCATLSSHKFVDSSPYYIIHKTGGGDDPLNPSALHTATVHLPVSLPPQLRQAHSLREWTSEQNACKDAAFQAYVALRLAGLVNDHLLPLRESDIFKGIKQRPGYTTVREQLDPWQMVASAWVNGHYLDTRLLRFSDAGGANQAAFDLILPVPIPKMAPLTLYWDTGSMSTISIESPSLRYGMDMLRTRSNDTGVLVKLAYGHRGSQFAATEKRHMLGLISRDLELSTSAIGAQEFGLLTSRGSSYLIRNPADSNHPYLFGGLLPSKPSAELVSKPVRSYAELPEDVPYVVAENWPKNTGYFYEPKPRGPAIMKPYRRVLPADSVKLDAIPDIYTRFGMCLPSLIRSLEIYLVAAELLTQRLEPLGLRDLDMVATAICAPAAHMPMNYERIEFLGDCILKLSAASNCLAHHPNWPEGLLSLMKDSFISNSRLAQASLDFGLDWYIITRPAAQRKWRPMYVEDHLQPANTIDQKRSMSTKTLADVVEALVGVSYIEGGLPKALDCVALFLPKEDWQGIDKAREALYEAAPADMTLPPTMEPLEALIGYTFGRKSLLVEAMTHSSYRMPGTHACFERLEFFGDSILEYLVVRRLFAVSHPKPLLHWEMHLLRTALVNADFLGFRVMEWAVEVPSNEVLAEPFGEPITVQPAPARFCLWSFMRYSSSELALAQRATGERHAALRESITEAMESGDRYPWALLARLQLQKYYSDVFESLLGAVYVDSGSFEACDGILERAGILPYMERMLRDGVNVVHPKEEIGQLAGSEEVMYLIDEKETADDGGRGLRCQVLVGGKIVAQVEGGVSREQVRTRAAEEAVRCLKGLKTKSYDGV